MSLSQRLKDAEAKRQRQTKAATGRDEPTFDGRSGTEGAKVIDLTDARSAQRTRPPKPREPSEATDPPQPLAHALRDAHLTAVTPTGVTYDPVRDGDASRAFHDPDPMVLDRTSTYACPRCDGETQVDLIDQVHHTVSLSCLSCFHMFRVEH
jgi:hypothetical protein